MSRKYLSLLLALFSVNCFAQKVVSGSFSALSSEKAVSVRWDFGSTVFEKKFNEREWESLNGETEWRKAKNEAMAVILKCINEELKKNHVYVVGENLSNECKYTIIVSPISLDRKGNNNSNYYLVDNNNVEVACVQIKGDGGHWGSLGNLMGDGYEEAAKKLGKLIKKSVR